MLSFRSVEAAVSVRLSDGRGTVAAEASSTLAVGSSLSVVSALVVEATALVAIAVAIPVPISIAIAVPVRIAIPVGVRLRRADGRGRRAYAITQADLGGRV